MPQLLEFLSNHPILSMTFFVLAGMLVWTFVGGGGSRRVEPGRATQLINHENALVIDVRSDTEYAQGHIVNAINQPLGGLAQQLSNLEKYRDRTIITACRNGQQAASASGILRKHGFEKVFSLSGGIVAWQGASLPLTKG
jgi:rhodanese-related sulfurtransferase